MLLTNIYKKLNIAIEEKDNQLVEEKLKSGVQVDVGANQIPQNRLKYKKLKVGVKIFNYKTVSECKNK